MTVLFAKVALAQKRREVGVLALTPEICSLIIDAGGPTFKPSGNGFVCNQTGEKVGKRTLAYSNRVSSLAAGPKPEKEKPEAETDCQNSNELPDLPKAIIHRGRVYCPYRCCRNVGIENYQGDYSDKRGTTMTCRFCDQQFFVE